MTAKPFRIQIADEVLSDVRDRVRRARLPKRRGDWEHGVSMDFMQAFQEYWLHEYDWRAAENRLNKLPQYTIRIEGLNLHFFWVKGSGPNPMPLILTHGWPGSVVEFFKAIELLTYPERFGGSVADSFDVVVPSLPGFGFSSSPEGTVGPRTTARLWRQLMTEGLGYPRFCAQGGDLGSMVTAYLGGDHQDVVAAIHLNFVPIRPIPEGELTVEERTWRDAAEQYRAAELDYFRLQAHRPQTLAVAMNDSPLGAAAWMLEKFHLWSDGGVAKAFHLDDLITNTMLYVATGQMASSIWFYRSFLLECEGRTHPEGRVEVPTGVAVFPKDMLNGRPPRSWAERDYNLTHWTEQPRGGHFACLEQRKLFVEDVRAFFRAYRAAS